MNAEDATASYSQLAHILRDSGLTWIVAQVEDDIRTGKTSQKQAPVPSERRRDQTDSWTVEGRGMGRREEFTALREYTPVEQLALLIDAIERAVRGAAQLEPALVRLSAFQDIDEIVLAGEGERGAVRSLDWNTGATRVGATQRLGRALAALRAEAR